MFLIGRINKIHEEFPSVVSRVISTLQDILLYLVNPVMVTQAYKFTRAYMKGLKIKGTKEYK